MEFTFFCYVCKRRVRVNGESEKDARQRFDACGHDRDKVKTLRKGRVGK